jgi:hypothetical protein
MKKLVLVPFAAALLLAAPAAASPTVRLAIVHTLHGCHVWATTRQLGAATTLTVKRGTALTIRVTCPMDYDVAQTAGPPVALGGPRWHTGTARTIVFRKAGLYRIVARNVQSSADLSLQTLGDDSVLTLTVRVTR